MTGLPIHVDHQNVALKEAWRQCSQVNQSSGRFEDMRKTMLVVRERGETSGVKKIT